MRHFWQISAMRRFIADIFVYDHRIKKLSKNKFVGNAEAAAIILSRWPDKINKATRFGIEPIRWAILKADSKCFELLVNAHPDHPGTDLYLMDHNCMNYDP